LKFRKNLHFDIYYTHLDYQKEKTKIKGNKNR
jgi:hypothetical protein